MGIFQKKSVICAICEKDLGNATRDDVFGHISVTHVDDAVRGNPSAGIKLFCGCEDATWSLDAQWPRAMTDHLKSAHGMKMR